MKVTIGEKEFTLKYNNKAIFKIEEEIGMSIFDLMNLESEKSQIELKKLHTSFTIVWAGIIEPISFDEFSDIADFNSVAALQEDVAALILKSFDTGVVEDKKKVAEKV